MGCVGVFTFIGFVLGCYATHQANHVHDMIERQKARPPNECIYGDQLFGSPVFSANPSTGPWYQIIGLRCLPTYLPRGQRFSRDTPISV